MAAAVESKNGNVLASGFVMALAEVRGMMKETIQWVDKKSGTQKSAEIVKIGMEFQPLSGSTVQVEVSCDHKVVPETLAKGSLVILHLTSLERMAGAWKARADRIEPFMR